MTEEKTKLVFYKRDFLYDNGLVNLFTLVTKEKSKSEKVIFELNDNSLSIEGTQFNIDETFLKLYTEFSEKIVYRTNNKRLYWNLELKKLIEENKFDVKGKTSGNDVKRITKKVSFKELGITKDFLIEQINNFIDIEKIKKVSKTDQEYEKKLINEKNKLLSSFAEVKGIENLTEKTKITIYQPIQEIAKLNAELSYKETLKKNKSQCYINLNEHAYFEKNSLVHPFEDGKETFTDLLNSNNDVKIGKWSYFIYQLGTRVMRYFSEENQDNKMYFFLQSHSLRNLYEIKHELSISENKVEIFNESTQKNSVFANNFHYFGHNSIASKHNFPTYGSQDKVLKLIVGMFLEVKSKESNWISIEDDNIFEGSSIYCYNETPSGKSTLIEYTNLSQILYFFNLLFDKNLTIKDHKLTLLDLYFRTDFPRHSLISILTKGSITNPKDEDRPYFQNFVSAFLDFQPLHSYYYQFQFNLFKNMDKQRVLPDSLKEFEDAYIAYTKGKDSPDLLIHELCYRVGREIGRFLGFLGDKHKDLIFVLRAVNNQPQLVAFLRDFEFKYLKEKETTQNGQNFSFSTKTEKNIDFFNSFETLLEIIAHQKNISMVRDYLSIYIISAFSKQQYHIKKDSDN